LLNTLELERRRLLLLLVLAKFESANTTQLQIHNEWRVDHISLMLIQLLLSVCVLCSASVSQGGDGSSITMRAILTIDSIQTGLNMDAEQLREKLRRSEEENAALRVSFGATICHLLFCVKENVFLYRRNWLCYKELTRVLVPVFKATVVQTAIMPQCKEWGQQLSKQ
jgi:hypothetical protein